MATFVPVKNKNGSATQAIIRKKGHKPVKKTFSTKAEAKAWAADQEKLIQQKRYKDPRLAEQVSLSDALKKFREYGEKIKKKAPSTLDREKTSQKHLLRILGKETPLSDIATIDIYKYQQQRINEKSSASSIRQEISLISKMYEIACTSWGLPVDNPVSSVERVPPPPGRERFLTSEEARWVIEESKNVRNKKFHSYVLLLMHTGMRPGEAAKLKISDFDTTINTVTIWLTKTKKPRVLPLSDKIISIIKNLPLEEDEYLYLKPHHRKAKTTRLNPSSIFKKSWARVLKNINNRDGEGKGVKHFNPHDLRHTAASHLLKAGVDIRTIADILGHSTLSMVMRYTHIFDTTRKEALRKIDYLGEDETETSDKEYPVTS